MGYEAVEDSDQEHNAGVDIRYEAVDDRRILTQTGGQNGVEASSKQQEIQAKVVIGITGASRCGKGWVSKGLIQALKATGKTATIVGQSEFWLPPNTEDQRRRSEDDPESTNHESFAAAIVEKTRTHDVVIAEGSQLLHHARVMALLKHIFL